MEENKNIEPEQTSENIPEEILPSEEIILPETQTVATELQTTNLTTETSAKVDDKLQTSEMEVHHHGHVHEKKKWKEYLFQFLMLFLAVFCGFLAEYQLEHKIERDREKQYMHSFIHDLENDAANLNEGFPRKDLRILAIDSVFLFFENNPDVAIIPGDVYRHIQRTLWDRHYRKNSTTVDQLKNAGGMRLIRKKEVADSIAAYDLQWQRAEFWKEAYVSNQQRGRDLIGKIINVKDLVPAYRKNNSATSLSSTVTDSLVIGINLPNLNEYLYFLSNLKGTTAQDKRAYQQIEQSAERLINLIKKEYNLE